MYIFIGKYSYIVFYSVHFLVCTKYSAFRHELHSISQAFQGTEPYNTMGVVYTSIYTFWK